MSMSRPNLLVFFTDQQRPDTAGCYGQALPVTPTLYRFATQGVRFENAFTPNPLCGPTRAGLQTGRYPSATGNHINNIHLPEDCETIAKLLSKAGYATGYLGKWHLASSGEGADCYRTTAVPPARRGGYADYWLAADALEWTSHGYGGTLFDAEGRAVTFDEETYRVDFMTDRLLGAMDQLAGDGRPFFLMASYLEPHHQNDRDAYEPPRGWEDRFADAEIPADLAAFPGSWGKHYANYLACCRSLDDNFARVLERLDALGLAENTLVAFISDHGCHFATRNFEYKRSCHDASIRVPFVLRGPGFTGGGVRRDFANLLDLPATLLRAAGVEVPGHWHGRPLQDIPDGDRVNEHLAQLSESQVGRVLRTERWTYSVRDPKAHRHAASGDEYVEDFLFDNEADPHQLTNLAVDPAYADVRSDLRERLSAAMQKAGEASPRIVPASPDAAHRPDYHRFGAAGG